MPKAKRNPKTGRFEVVQDRRGIPGGWTPIVDKEQSTERRSASKPSNTKKTAPSKIIRVSHPVETNSNLKNRAAVAALGDKMRKAGMPIFEINRLKKLKPRSGKGTEGAANKKGIKNEQE